MLTKSKILLASLSLSVASLVTLYFLDFDTFVCQAGVVNSPVLRCTGVLLAYVCLVFIPVLLCGLITYRMDDKVFLVWRKFSQVYFLVYALIIVIAPWNGADFISLEKQIMIMFFCSLYIAISLILIAYKSYQLRGK